MSLTIRYGTDSSVCKTMIVFTGGFQSRFDGTSMSWIVTHCDVLGWIFNDYVFYVPSSTIPVAKMFGFAGYELECRDFNVTHPVSQSFSPGSSYDQVVYGSIVHNFRVFAEALGGPRALGPTPTGEHSCRHITYSGELITKQTELVLDDGDFNAYGLTTSAKRFKDGKMYYGCHIDSLNPLSCSYLSYSWPLESIWSLVDILGALTRQESTTYHFYGGGGSWLCVLSGLEFSVSDDWTTIDYHMSVDEAFYGSHQEWDAHVSIQMDYVQDPTVQPLVGNAYYTYPAGLGQIHLTCTNVVSTYYSHQASYSYTGDAPMASYRAMMTLPMTVPSIAEQEHCYYVFSALNDQQRFLRKFASDVDDAWLDISASALFSTVDAFKKAEGYLGVNVLQDLVKIPDIASAIPNVREAVDVLGRLVRRDLSFSTLKEILDLATSTQLQASFQWRPYVDLIRKYIPAMVSTFHSLGDIHGYVIGHGSYSTTLHNKLGRQEVTLHTRTKLVMDASPSGLLSAILGIDALGLLPKYSNIWDMIPFSFVANWFTGIGESIRRAEYMLLLATIPASFVHTYTLSSPLTSDEVDLLEMSTSTTGGASLRLYYRDVSLYNPPFRDSNLGFGLPTGLPPLGTLGSLLYQLIFG